MSKIFILNVDKKSLFDGSIFNGFSTEAGETAQALLKWLTNYYNFSYEDLIKDERDHFPYFTDGGFKYKVANSNWEYTFTCFVKHLIQ